MTSQKTAVPSGAQGYNLPAQRGPDEASERPRTGGMFLNTKQLRVALLQGGAERFPLAHID